MSVRSRSISSDADRTRPITSTWVVALALGLLAASVAGCGTEPRRPAPPGGPAATTTVDPRTQPLPPGPATVTVIGDSVILGAKTQVPAALEGWKVTFDAKESRRIQAGVDILKSHKGPPPRVVVIHLCTNWGRGDYGTQIDAAMAVLDGVDRVVWVTCQPWSSDVASADAAIAAAAERYPNVVVADWGAIAGRAGYAYDDHLHLRTAGAEALAALVAEAVGAAPTPS